MLNLESDSSHTEFNHEDEPIIQQNEGLIDDHETNEAPVNMSTDQTSAVPTVFR